MGHQSLICLMTGATLKGLILPDYLASYIVLGGWFYFYNSTSNVPSPVF